MSGIYTIYDVLDKIEKRPGLYLGYVSLRTLATYLAGYQMAMTDAAFMDISNPEFHQFNDFIRDKFGYLESTAGWSNMILAISLGFSPDNVDWCSFYTNISTQQHLISVSRFFELLAEFRHIDRGLGATS